MNWDAHTTPGVNRGLTPVAVVIARIDAIIITLGVNAVPVTERDAGASHR